MVARRIVHAVLLLLLLSCLGAVKTKGQPILYNTSSSRDPSKLNIHLVPHTHDDSGWLKTFEQYYWGTRQDIQMAGVQYVMSTVVQALLDNPHRKFSYAEMSFFTRWWHLQTPRVQQQVRQLVASGQLDFVNGGFVQHDEAAAHYAAMIDQTTRGHRFLNNTFGFVPKVAWQIDPFGHSATQAALLSAAAGFEALFFGRADYQDMKLRASKRQLELLWRPCASWGEAGQIFTQNYPSGNYGPPSGFNFDWGQLDPPIVDDPSSPEFNLRQRVDLFVAQAQAWSNLLRGNDVLFMMGSDFEYANAHAIFANLDKFIHHVNADGRVNVFYSTPAAYVAAKASYSNTSWPVKADDFFPYADCPHCYWTGYFTSRPTSKGYIRQATAYLAAARQLQALAAADVQKARSQQQQQQQQQRSSAASSGAGCRRTGPQQSSSGSSSSSAEDPHTNPVQVRGSASTSSSSSSSGGGSSSTESSINGSSSTLEALEFAVSISQHHDAITGTEKQAVANDYARYLFVGMEQAGDVVNAALQQLLTRSLPAASPQQQQQQQQQQQPATPAAAAVTTATTGGSSSSSSSSSTRAWLQGIMARQPGFGVLLQDLCQGLAKQQGCWRALLRSILQWCEPSASAAAAASSGNAAPTTVAASSIEAAGGPAAAAAAGDLPAGIKLAQCPLLNVSICLPSVRGTAPAASSHSSIAASRQLHMAAAAAGHISEATRDSSSSSSDVAAAGGLLVVVYNSLAWPRQEWVRVPVAAAHNARYTVQDADGSSLPSQLLSVPQSTLQLQQGLAAAGLAGDPAAAASSELVFKAELPPVGYASFVVQQQHSSSSSSRVFGNAGSPAAATVTQQLHELPAAAAADDPDDREQHTSASPTSSSPPSSTAAAAAAAAAAPPAQQLRQLSNGRINLTLDAATGRFFSVAAADGAWAMRLRQEMMWYKSSNGEEEDRQTSGAYIFRPAKDGPVAQPLSSEPLKVTIESGPLLIEVRQAWAPWASLVTRLWAGADWLEQQWSVGPIPADGVGKEIVIRSSTDLQSGGLLFTDSNGREMLTRKLNARPTWPLTATEPVAGNYYPITAAAAISDGCMGLGLATDRAQGAASLADGQLEVMLHRLTAVDDARGVGEPLNETLCGTPPGTCPAGGLPARGKHLLLLGLMQTLDPAAAAAEHSSDAERSAAAEHSAAQHSADGVGVGDSRMTNGAAASGADGGEAAGADGLQQQGRQWHGVPRMLRQAAQLLNDPVLMAFGQLPAASNAPQQQQQQQQQRGATAGVISSLGLAGRWSGLAPAAAATGCAGGAAAAAVAAGLPANVHLLTLMRAEEGDASHLIIRLAHNFQVDEDQQLSQPARVDLAQLLSPAFHITSTTELSLTANQRKADMPKPRAWRAEQEPLGHDSQQSSGSSSSSGAGMAAAGAYARWGGVLGASSKCGSRSADHEQQQQQQQQRWASSAGEPYNIWEHPGDDGRVVELFPMEIRTWLVEVEACV